MIIGIAGKALAGKTTAANYIADRYGFKRIGFADPLKRGLAEFTGLPLRMFYDQDIKNIDIPEYNNKSLRQMMQFVGTDCFRNNFGKDFWIRRMVREIPDLEKKGITKIVIDDIRFQEEAEMIMGFHGPVIFITRPGTEKDSHASEQLAVGYDYLIDNDKDIPALLEKVKRIYEQKTICKL